MFDKYTSFRPSEAPARNRVIYGDAGALVRGQILLSPATWAKLKRLSTASQRTSSQVIEALIGLADQARGGKR